VGCRRTPQNSLRGHSWENRPDIRIFFWADIGVLIRIVPPLPQIFEVLSGLYGISFENFYKIYKKISYYLNQFLK